MEKEMILPLDLQLFADGGEGDQGDQGSQEADEQEKESITLTAEELAKKIEAESDRKLAKALEKRQAEFEQRLEAERKKAKEEGESYARMTEEQKQKAEAEKEREEFEKERQAFYAERLKLDIQKDLRERGLPEAFADTLVHLGDKETIISEVVKLEKEWQDTLKEKLNDSITQKKPFGNMGGKREQVNKFAKRANERKNQTRENVPNPWK